MFPYFKKNVFLFVFYFISAFGVSLHQGKDEEEPGSVYTVNVITSGHVLGPTLFRKVLEEGDDIHTYNSLVNCPNRGG